ncbi:hypothetical protein SG34_013635 [Thalassomonas viridans]|uniref:Uncharacterized protein n=1 Tax=Thalassomonas viridans TaxID=137584 RepID=A0AAF0C9S5_9GAMM|nr:hypothetical protein [Thalassomonas viridans]WDE07827.1 hypothetical protein SG34_013635 [Thalassomonas viridans]
MSEVEFIIYKLLAREVELPEFEQWVYSEACLENMLSADEYLDLISLNYKTPSSLYEAEKILKPHISISKYFEWFISRVLHKIIERPNDVYKYIEQCYDLYCDGFGFLDNLGMGYGLHIPCLPDKYKVNSWDELSIPEQEKLIDSFYPAVLEEAQKVLSWLNTGKIQITGHDGGYQGIEYEDHRSIEEKEPTGYHISKKRKKWWKFWS